MKFLPYIIAIGMMILSFWLFTWVLGHWNMGEVKISVMIAIWMALMIYDIAFGFTKGFISDNSQKKGVE